MNHEDINEHIEDTAEQHVARRSALRLMGLLAGGLLAGGTLLRGSAARAQGTGAMEADGMAAGGMASGMVTTDGAMAGGMADMSMVRVTAASDPVPGLTPLSQKNARRISSRRAANDIDILNSALVLEYLESEFYSRVVAADMHSPYLEGRVKEFARVLQRDEGTHVQTVTEMITLLGGQPVAKPVFQFPAGVFISPISFLNISSVLEENGVSAYLGAAPLVRNKEVLNFAASIYGNEARHSGMIRYYLGTLLAPRDLEKPITLAQATANAAPFIAPGQGMPQGTSQAMTTGGMMDETMRSYVSADEAGRRQLMAPMSLRQQVEFLTRFYQTPVTGPQMVSLGMVSSNMTDPNNMAGTTTGGAMSVTMPGGMRPSGTMPGGTMPSDMGGTPQGGGM